MSLMEEVLGNDNVLVLDVPVERMLSERRYTTAATSWNRGHRCDKDTSHEASEKESEIANSL